MERVEKPIADLVNLVEQPLKNGKEVALVIRGNSMWPLLHEGVDKILLKRVDFYNICDIILYRRASGDFVLHRIIGKKNGAFILAGDGEFRKEYPIYENQILAKATGGIRKGKPFSCDSKRYKLYSFVWAKILPLRPIIIKIGYRLMRLRNKLKRL